MANLSLLTLLADLKTWIMGWIYMLMMNSIWAKKATSIGNSGWRLRWKIPRIVRYGDQECACKPQLQILAAASIEEVNAIKHKDVAGTVPHAAMLCQLWNVRHLIWKGGFAKITDVNGRNIKINVKEGGVEAPEMIYRSRSWRIRVFYTVSFRVGFQIEIYTNIYIELQLRSGTVHLL